MAFGALEIAQNQAYVLCLCKDLSSRPSTPWLSEHCQVQPGGPQHCQGSSGGLASLCLSSTKSPGLSIEPYDPVGQVSPGVVPRGPLEHCSGDPHQKKKTFEKKKRLRLHIFLERETACSLCLLQSSEHPFRLSTKLLFPAQERGQQV